MTSTSTRAPYLPAAYRAHPLLDPLLPSRQPSIARLWVSTWRSLQRDPDAYDGMLRVYALPAGTTGDRDLRDYFHDADLYLDDLLRLVPGAAADALRPLEATRLRNDLGELLRMTFDGDTPRARYEAQRKLYLAKLLFDIDHCRSVRDGLRHKEQWERLLAERLWHDASEGEEVEICCRLEPVRGGPHRLEVGLPKSHDTRCWRFRPRRLPRRNGDAAVDVYLYRSRFKREGEPASELRMAQGLYILEESPRWPALGRRSGSILSKMIRRGIGDPRMVQDLLGAMFIVGSRQEAYALERRLVGALGGPLRWRDRVDTLAGERDRPRLDPRSSSAFQVLKQIVDVLMRDESGAGPYLFPVEVQIYPLEAYLRTLHDAHFASHTAYKRRQFLVDLLPLLFPSVIYGAEHPVQTLVATT